MIKWIMENLGTCAYGELTGSHEYFVVDVRDLVDKAGNSIGLIEGKIEEALKAAGRGEKVVLCCDMGISRSNAVAVGVYAVLKDVPFAEALRHVVSATKEKQIKIEVLSSVQAAAGKFRPERRVVQQNGIKRILITGSDGHIGTRLAGFLEPLGEVVPLKHHQADLVEGAMELDLIVKENDISDIIHLAHPVISNNNSAIGDALVMCKNVLNVCALNRARLIFLSSADVFCGYTGVPVLAKEDTPPLPGSTDGEAKYLCETLIETHKRLHGVDCAILRSPKVYGFPGKKPAIIYNFIGKALSSRDIVTHRYSNGLPNLELLHITDLCRAVKLVVEKNYSGTINVGSDEAVKTRELAEIIISIVKADIHVSEISLEGRIHNVKLDNSRAASILGWSPEINLRDGLKEIIRSLI